VFHLTGFAPDRTGGRLRQLMASVRRTAHLVAVSTAARAPALLVPILMAAIFGSGSTTDAYFLAYSAVLFVGGTLGQGMEQAVVPFAAREIHRADGSARPYLEAAARGSAGAGVVVWLLCVPVLDALASPGLRAMVLVYAMCFTPLVLAWCAASTFSGALIGQWKIATATGSMLWRGAGAAAGLMLVPFGAGLTGVAVGLGAGEIARLWWLRRALIRTLPAELDARAPHAPLGGLARAASAQVGASAAIGGAPVVERLFAMSLGVGAVSHLEYAMRVFSAAAVVFDGALVPLLLARWTSHVTVTGATPARRDVWHAIAKGLAVAAAIALILVAGAGPIVSLVLRHGHFTAADATAVAGVLRALSAAYVANAGASLVERYYIAARRNRTLAMLSVGRAGLRLLTVWLFLQTQGLLAFPIGFAVSEFVYLGVLLVLISEGRAVSTELLP